MTYQHLFLLANPRTPIETATLIESIAHQEETQLQEENSNS